MRFKKLIESRSTGWNADELYRITSILDELNNINYEINFCSRGAFSSSHTYAELSNSLQSLAKDLADAAEDIADVDAYYDELDEDTVKLPNGKWANVGKAGSHGQFNTKKEADAQRRAMFVNK